MISNTAALTDGSVLQACLHTRLRETLCLLSGCMQERGPLTSRTSAWVAWHSCLGGRVGVGLGRLKQRWEGVGCDWPVPVCGNLLLYPRNSSSVEVLCHVMGRILLRVRDPVT